LTYSTEDFKSIRISDTVDRPPVCNFKNISHFRDLKSIRISDTVDHQSAILSIFEIEDFKSIRISDTVDHQSAILSVFEIGRISKVSEFLIFWATSLQF
jgi:hypothetical protein